MKTVKITFNGEPKEVQSSNVALLLKEFSLENKKLAVELNREIVKRGSYEQTSINSGDSIEIVTFVGGG